MSNKRDIAVILLGFLPNPRFEKRITVEKEIFDLHVICWDRGSEMFAYPEEDGYKLHTLQIEACNDPLRRMYPYLQFFRSAKKLLKKLQPKLIHVQGLDMLKIAIDYKKKHPGTRVIYEVADLHRLIVDKQKSPFRIAIQKILRWQDKELCDDIDLLICTSEQYINKYFGDFVPKNKQMVFPNVPDLSAFKNYRKKKYNGRLTVGYIGGIRYKKQIKNLLLAAQKCNVNVMLAGFESNGNEIEALCINMPNVEWIGRYDFNTQAAELYGKCDLIYSVYDANMANVRVALPNKLYESVYCEVPIIVARNTYLAKLVEQWCVGVAVDYDNVEELKEVLRRFCDEPGVLIQYEGNCRKQKDICNLEYHNERLIAIIKSWFK